MKHLPVGLIKGETLAEAWEESLVWTWKNGIDVPTHYDLDTDPPSKEATIIVQVAKADTEPIIHKCLPAGIADLYLYEKEITESIHDSWVTDADDTRWSYSYSKRIFKYKDHINQIETNVIPQLCKYWHSKRAQVVTWDPDVDRTINHAPCLNRLFFRLTKDEADTYLHMTSMWRSRDGFRAWSMNAYAMVQLMKQVKDQIAEALDTKIHIGTYMDISNSWHIYGKYFPEVKAEIKKYETGSYLDRSWNSNKQFIQDIFNETQQKLDIDVDYMLSK